MILKKTKKFKIKYIANALKIEYIKYTNMPGFF